jgi:TonB-linked SusC/RagA family outer membrane protein
MITKRVLKGLLGLTFFAAAAGAQQAPKTVRGQVTNEQGAPIPNVQVAVKGTTTGTSTNSEGNYFVRATDDQVLQYRLIGFAPEERAVGQQTVINVQLRRTVTKLNEVVTTALGQTATAREIGTAQQTVSGAAIAESQRTNFVNALQGRVAGVEVTSSSGVPGASSMITIRGTSSISSSNQPLFIIDGLPMDNKTLNTGVLASDAPGSVTALSNRGVDFTNRAADINPDDIESLVVLKGPEASALYGIDAANGAIVITTKRGKVGGGLEYNNAFSIASPRGQPELQRVYGLSNVATTNFYYFGAPYQPGTKFYNNIDGFFRNAFTQRHNLAFSGAAADSRINYRISTGLTREEGVVPNSSLDKVNLTGASQVQVNKWLMADLSMAYTNATNDQSLKGDDGPLIGLLVWPQTDNAKDYLTAAGTRRRLTGVVAGSETDNPYFSVNKNLNNSKNNRLISNLGLTIQPFSWGNLKTNVGVDSYTNETSILRHPESALGYQYNGVYDQAADITRSINAQTLLNFNSYDITSKISISGFLGNQVSDYKSTTDALKGQDFLDPNFVSINNTNLRIGRTTIAQRRLLSGFGSATIGYDNYLYLTATGRNDWTSTIPKGRNSFFYPSVSGSFIFSDAFPTVGRYMTGKLRAAYAEVGKDAKPYAYRPSLEYKTTSYGGYGYGFTGPNLDLKPEFARSYEVGTELSFLHDRLGVDATYYRKQTKDQIVNDIRGSYGTGFVLFNLNGAVTRNQGIELTLHGTPVQSAAFSWDVLANFDRSRGKVISLPHDLPETYVSDTWLYGNVRNGTAPGMSTESLTGFFYLRNNDGQLLIDPTTGLPIRSSTFVDGGYDRHPDFTLGLTNSFKYNRFSLNFLLDFRKGGDVFDATDHYLTVHGLSMQTLDRNTPRVIAGVIRDGKENTPNPTINNIVVTPSMQPGYYTGMSEELFIEKNINWMRLKDVTLSYALPEYLARNASVFVTGTDLFLLTNYTGLDPIVNGNSAAVGGSGGVGIDYGNFPVPRTISFGIRAAF